MSLDGNENIATKTMNLPIQEHFYKLECMIEELINDIEENDKQIQMLKGDFLTLGYENNQQNGDISLFVQDEITRLGKENQQQILQNQDEISEIKQIIKRVKELKKSVGQQVVIIDHRVQELESNIGFKYFFDPNLPSDEVQDPRQNNVSPKQAHFEQENQEYNQDSEDYQDNYDQEY
ncbi:hypothetical protein ABPG74_018682 [Tetrahymena malaccensis]